MRRGLIVPVAALILALPLLPTDPWMAWSDEGQWVAVNVDGDVAYSPAEDRGAWNPHACGFTEAVEWDVAFTDRVEIAVTTPGGEAGHVATGMWWTTSFPGGAKIPLPATRLRVEVDVRVVTFRYAAPGDWLRVAVACAVQRASGMVVYTELDLLDSPGAQRHPRGNLPQGGDVVYRGGDVVEFQIDEAPVGAWRHYSIDVTRYVDRAWGIREGDHLESVYVVVECEGGPVEVAVEVDNLWVWRQPDG